ncbi:MAG TPA: uroporphyrinogen-III C-methyltransferase [Longimicrobiales bacterium]|nr:uroporphyrinogen-III C-methyltransferase [Longimicrobiales bacterium]
MGTVYLVGAGPGDPGLLTRRAARLLRRADIVVHDALLHPRLLDLAPPSAERVDVGKRRGHGSVSQERINEILIEAASRAAVVVRLKGGDPFVFGRGGEEALALARAGVRFEIVPGVTAAVAVAAYAGVPLTHRGLASAATLMTGHDALRFTDPDDLRDGNHTLAIYMGMKELGTIAQRLIASGRAPDTPTAVIEWGTYARQRTVVSPLAAVADAVSDAGLGSPALVVVGDVVRLREHLDWFEARPLFGRRVLVPRSRPQPSRLAARLRVLGAEVIEFPAAVSLPARDPGPLREAAARLSEYDGLLFTSAIAVRRFWKELVEAGLDARALRGPRIVACGTATTTALHRFGIHPDVALSTYDAERVVAAFEARVGGALPGTILFPSESGVISGIADRLRAHGHRVDAVEAFRVHFETDGASGVRERLDSGDVDYVAFASSGTVEVFSDVLGASAGAAAVAAIGPDTADTARRRGFSVEVVPEEHTLDGLAQALLRHAAALDNRRVFEAGGSGLSPFPGQSVDAGFVDAVSSDADEVDRRSAIATVGDTP